MEHKISVLFIARKAKKTKENLVPVYMRITVNGERLEHSVNRYVDLSKWSSDAGRLKGSSQEARSLNNYLDALKNKVDNIEREMILDGIVITYDTFKEKWLGITEKPRMLMELFQNHNDRLKDLLGKEFSPATLIRYNTTRDHTKTFLQWKLGVGDIDIRKLNYEFIVDFEFWLKSKRNCNHNTTIKYLSNFRKIINGCVKKGWLSRDPFTGFKMAKKEVEREFLSELEIQAMANKQFQADRLNQVRDIFLFSCFTGLAYVDVQKLKRSELGLGIDGSLWIFTNRKKTATVSRIPVLPRAAAIIKKYEEHPQCMVHDKVLPVLSNQKMNAYLKEIADICGIQKNLTFHIARHTFATTVTLSNGVSMESVSKMLGHKNLRTTQHYAKILDTKVSGEMNLLKEKLPLGTFLNIKVEQAN